MSYTGNLNGQMQFVGEELWLDGVCVATLAPTSAAFSPTQKLFFKEWLIERADMTQDEEYENDD